MTAGEHVGPVPDLARLVGILRARVEQHAATVYTSWPPAPVDDNDSTPLDAGERADLDRLRARYARPGECDHLG